MKETFDSKLSVGDFIAFGKGFEQQLVESSKLTEIANEAILGRLLPCQTSFFKVFHKKIPDS